MLVTDLYEDRRVGHVLPEDAQHARLPVLRQSLHGVLGPVYVLLDQHAYLRSRPGILQDGVRRPPDLVQGETAPHAEGTGPVPRLDDHWQPDLGRDLDRAVRIAGEPESWYGKSCLA